MSLPPSESQERQLNLEHQANAKAIINHVVERHGDRVRQLAKELKTFENLLLKYEQNNEPPPKAKSSPAATSMCVPFHSLPRPRTDALVQVDDSSSGQLVRAHGRRRGELLQRLGRRR